MSADELGDDAATLDVADQHDRNISRLGKSHIGDVACSQIDLGGAARAFDKHQIGGLGEPAERGQDPRQQARRKVAIFRRRGAAPYPPVDNDLRAALGLRL